jgi:hypothetical protein
MVRKPPFPNRSLAHFLLLVVAVIEVASSSPHHECELFIALSTLPNSGIGLFSAVEKKPGDTIGNGELAFPILLIDGSKGFGQIVNCLKVFKDYGWFDQAAGMALESSKWPIIIIGIGVYSAANSVIPLENVNLPFPLLHSSHGYDLPYMPHRSIDPGAGSVSPYRAANTIVSRRIPAGGEVFVNYGDAWFEERPEYFEENFPLSVSFREADALLTRYEAFDFSPLYDTVLEMREIWKSSSRVFNILPASEGDLNLALENGVKEIHQKDATRSIEWLRAHGTCVDHIAHKPSTIADGVGEGAFAKRRLPKGTVITGSPLWILQDEGYLDLGDAFDYGDDVDVDDRSHMRQILYNYCFGHEETGLLFLPYASAGALFINHGNGQKANVGVQWASPGKLRHDPSSFKLSPHQIMDKDGPQLGIEYIALADIEEGDELLLDYGEKWQEAWDEHVEKWRPVKETTIASDWNIAADEPIRTKAEEIINPYPASIILRCHVDLLSQDESTWMEMEWSRDEGPQMYGEPCEVLERSADNTTYQVSFKTDEDGGEILYNVPRRALFFLDAPHESDLFLENAFRFPIQLPDEMIPDAWKNKKRNPPTGGGHDEL